MNFAVLFDLDGTLVNSLADICDVLNRTRHGYGLPPLPEKQIRPYIGKGVEYLIENTFRELISSYANEIIEKYRVIYSRNPGSQGQLYEGVRETLETLRKNPVFKLGVATNKPTGIAGKTLEFYLPGFQFDVVRGPDSVSQKKPAPEHLLETLEFLEVPPERAWFVGDDPVDEACAVAAKVKFLGAGWGFGGVEPKAPNLKLGQFSEILRFLSTPG